MKKSTRPKALWTTVAGAVPVSAPKREPKPRKMRKPIRSRTSDRAKDEIAYRIKSVQFAIEALKQNRCCPVTGRRFDLLPQVHHIYGRIGKLLNWEPGWILVSFAGHEWIHRNVTEARKRGWLAPIGQWNNPKVMEQKL